VDFNNFHNSSGVRRDRAGSGRLCFVAGLDCGRLRSRAACTGLAGAPQGVANEIFASPVGAQGRVYVTGRDGISLVIRNAPTFEVLAKNTLDDGFDASPALVDNEIYMRGYKSLYCIAAR
jgi:hypothetical protein